jgi:hypothetical protein
VDNALELLTVIGALQKVDEELTALGQHLAMLPLDPRIGKALVYATLLGCLDPVLTITSVLSHRNPFVAPLGKQQEADQAKRRLAGGEPSDHRAVLEAYDAWTREDRNGRGGDFCWRNFLSSQNLRMVRDMRRQFTDLLRGAGLVRSGGGGGGGHEHGHVYGRSQGGGGGRGVDDAANRNAGEWAVVKAALFAGLYPNLLRVDVGRHKFKTRFFSKGVGKVQPHPSSVNAAHNDWEHRWLMYFERQRTQGGVFAYDTTEVAPLSIMVFGAGDTSGDPDRRGRLIPFDDRARRIGSSGGNGSGRNGGVGSDGGGGGGGGGGNAAGGAGMEDGAGEEASEPIFFHEDETVQFIGTFLLQQPQRSFGMAKLSGFLKRNFPQHKNNMGGIRGWVGRHDDVFALGKPQGAWMVSLLDGACGGGGAGGSGAVGGGGGGRRRRHISGVWRTGCF